MNTTRAFSFILHASPLVPLLLLPLGASVARAAEPAGWCHIDLVLTADAILGFDVTVDGKLVAPVRFSSNGLIFGVRARGGGSRLKTHRIELKAREGTGLKLSGYVRVHYANLPQPGEFPEVSFSLKIDEFNSQQWEKAVGRVPFHFLATSMPEAQVVHQRGWLHPTPQTDRFPFLGDIHAGSPEICANWSRNWSYVVPIGCYPLPVVGLWSPDKKLYVGYDFMDSRLAEQSERYLASAYCWRQGEDRQFITLAYPYAGRGFQTLTYPEKGAVVEGRFRLVYSTSMSSADDPNAFLQQDYFRRYGRQLPPVPAMNDLGWMPGGTRLKSLPAAPREGLVIGVPEGSDYEDPRTVEIGGWTWHRESVVASAFRRGDRKLIEQLKREIAYLNTKAVRLTIDGDECLFWPKPLEGKWRDAFGGEAVKTLHNTNGWAAGIVLVDLYRREKNAEYLPLIDGIFNWTRHFVWTRNEFADVPSSPFAIGGTLSTAFLLDYYYAFCDDPQRAARARAAVELARNITYRYLIAWACDNDRDDNLDSSFLWEPNSGRDWVGTACANEVHWNLDTLTQVYVNCGDPILSYYLRGALERWHLLYKGTLHDSLADYEPDALSEWLGLFDGTMAGRGGRASFGTADMLPLHYPVGQSILRVTCGRKAAFACCKGGVHSRIEDYRYGPGVNFAMTVRSTKREPFDVTLSFPFADLTDRPLTLTRQGQTRTLGQQDLVRSPDAPSYVYVRHVQDGDTLTVGRLSADAAPLPLGNDWTARPGAGPDQLDEAARPPAFREVNLPLDEPLRCDWDDTESFAGLWPGRHWAWSVPLYLVPAAESTGPLGTSKPCQVPVDPSATSIYVALAPKAEGGTVKLRFEGDAPIDVALPECAIAWRSWPPCFHRKLLVARVSAAPVRAGPKPAKLTIVPDRAWLLAVTQLADAAQEHRTAEVFRRGQAEYRSVLAEEARIRRFSALVDRVPEGHIAILPKPELAGPVAKFLRYSGLMKKCRLLSPDDLLDAKLFNAQRLPVVLNLGDENYAGTVRQDDDGAEAILGYLRSGGFLVMLTSQPLPFCYDGLGASHKPRSLTPRMGFPLATTFEKPPEDGLKIVFRPGQDWLTGFPATIPFFTEGDLRLRSILPGEVSRDAAYTPIVSVTAADGRSFGDAAALAQFRGGPYRGARVLYVWSRLLADPQLGPDIIAQALQKIIVLP